MTKLVFVWLLFAPQCEQGRQWTHCGATVVGGPFSSEHACMQHAPAGHWCERRPG